MDHLNQPVVLDNGSGTLKAGFAGSDSPSAYFPSYVGTFERGGTKERRGRAAADGRWCSPGRPKHTRVMAGAVEGDTFIGKKAQELRGLLRIK
jgi:centractin